MRINLRRKAGSAVMVTAIMMSNKSVEWLQEELESSGGGGGSTSSSSSSSPPTPSSSPPQLLLLLDCRSHELYESSHISSAINLAIPGLMLRRLKKGNLPIRSIIPNNEDKERFARRCKTDVVVLYDEATTSEHRQQQQDGGGAAPGSSVLGLLLQKLRDDGCKAFYLEGGFNKFQSEYPEHCEQTNNLDSYSSSSSSSLCPSSSPPAAASAVLGLGGLRISSDSNCSEDGESDRSELSGCSATESSAESSGCSPASAALQMMPNMSSNHQQQAGGGAFPVQILPYLFLGCAKDSTNLDVLGKHNIKYILNVTPNLPNVFEHDGDFKYKQIPISDHWSQNLSQFFPEAISFIDEARSKKCGVLVHCLAGISRSVTVTVAYLMQKLSLSLNDAYDFVKRKKSNISPNFNFMGQLLDFERTLGLHSPSSCDNNSSSSSSPTGGGHHQHHNNHHTHHRHHHEQQLFFTTPTNHNVFQLDSTLDST